MVYSFFSVPGGLSWADSPGPARPGRSESCDWPGQAGPSLLRIGGSGRAEPGRNKLKRDGPGPGPRPMICGSLHGLLPPANEAAHEMYKTGHNQP